MERLGMVVTVFGNDDGKVPNGRRVGHSQVLSNPT